MFVNVFFFFNKKKLKGKEEFSSEDEGAAVASAVELVPEVVPVVPAVSSESLSCLMEEIEEERQGPPVMHQGKKAFGDFLEQEMDEDLRAKVVSSLDMYNDEMDDSYLVHADVTMEKLGVDEVEDAVQRNNNALEEVKEEDKTQNKQQNNSNSNNINKNNNNKNKASRGRRKQLSMKKTGIMNVVPK